MVTNYGTLTSGQVLGEFEVDCYEITYVFVVTGASSESCTPIESIFSNFHLNYQMSLTKDRKARAGLAARLATR